MHFDDPRATVDRGDFSSQFGARSHVTENVIAAAPMHMWSRACHQTDAMSERGQDLRACFRLVASVSGDGDGIHATRNVTVVVES